VGSALARRASFGSAEQGRPLSGQIGLEEVSSCLALGWGAYSRFAPAAAAG
jgi:hypothetical protein